MNRLTRIWIFLIALLGFSAPSAANQDFANEAASTLSSMLSLGNSPSPSTAFVGNPYNAGIYQIKWGRFSLPSNNNLHAAVIQEKNHNDSQKKFHHVVVELDAANLAQDIFRAISPELAQIAAGGGQFQGVVAVVSERDTDLDYNAIPPSLAGRTWLLDSSRKLSLKKGVNFFAKMNSETLGPLGIALLQGGSFNNQNDAFVLKGQVGYDVLGTILSKSNVNSSQNPSNTQAANPAAPPSPFPVTLELSYPGIITPAPFNSLLPDQRSAFFSELSNTSVAISLTGNPQAPNVAITATQTNTLTVNSNKISIAASLGISRQNDGSLEISAEGKQSFSRINFGPSVAINEIRLGGTISIDGNGNKSGQTDENGKSVPTDKGVGVSIGATFLVNNKPLKGDLQVAASNSDGKVSLTDISFVIDGSLPVIQNDPVLGTLAIDSPAVGVSLGNSSFYVAGGVTFNGLSSAAAVFTSPSNGTFIVMHGDQTSLYDVFNAFDGGNTPPPALRDLQLPEVIMSVGLGATTGNPRQGIAKSDLPAPVQDMLDSAGTNTLPFVSQGVALSMKLEDKSGTLNELGLGSPTVYTTGAINNVGRSDMSVSFSAAIGGNISTQNSNDPNQFYFSVSDPSLRFDLKPSSGEFRAGLTGQFAVSLPAQNTNVRKSTLYVQGSAYVDIGAEGAGVGIEGYIPKGKAWEFPLGIDGISIYEGAVLLELSATGSIEFGSGVSFVYWKPGDRFNRNYPYSNNTNYAVLEEANNPSARVDESISISTGMLFKINASGALEKFGFAFNASELSMSSITLLNDIMLNGIAKGPAKEIFITALAGTDPTMANAYRNMLNDSRFVSFSEPMMDTAADIGIDLDAAKLKNVKLFFATPGVKLPGFANLSGEAGFAIGLDLYTKDVNGNYQLVELYKGVPKFNISMTTNGVEMDAVTETARRAALAAYSDTIGQLVDGAQCPAGYTFNMLDKKCLKCSGDMILTGRPGNKQNACVAVELKYSQAKYLGKPIEPWSCPIGEFFDPRNFGECWTCPGGTFRNLEPVTSGKACTAFPSAETQPAKRHAKATGIFGTDCPSGKFWHAATGYCYSCPGGTISTAFGHPDGPDACFGVNTGLADTKAAVRGSKRAIPAGNENEIPFVDVGLNQIWSCPTGYIRSTHHVKDYAGRACVEPSIKTSEAMVTARGQIKSDWSNLCLTKEGYSSWTGTACSKDGYRQSYYKDSLDRLRPTSELGKLPPTKRYAIKTLGKNQGLSLTTLGIGDEQLWTIDKKRRIINNDTLQCLTADSQGSGIRMADCKGGNQPAKTQTWTFGDQLVDAPPRGALAFDKAYTTTLAIGDDQCLQADAKQNRGTMSIQACSTSPRQKWRMETNGHIQNLDGGTMCLDVAGAKTEPGTPVQQWSCVDVPQQQWVQDGSLIRSMKHFDRCLAFSNNQLMINNCDLADASQNWALSVFPEQPVLPAAPQPKESTISWPQVPHTLLRKVVVNSKYRHQVGIGTDGYVYWHDARGDDYWKQIGRPGGADAVSVAWVGPNRIAMTNKAGAIYVSSSFSYGSQKWHKVSGKASQVFGNIAGDFWHLSYDIKDPNGYNMYRWTGSRLKDEAAPKDSGWSQIQGHATHVALGTEYHYHVNSTGTIYRSPANGIKWQGIPGKAAKIATDERGYNVWRLSWAQTSPGMHSIYGSTNKGDSWTLFRGEASEISVDKDGQPWHIGNGNNVYRAADASIRYDGQLWNYIGAPPGVTIFRQVSSGFKGGLWVIAGSGTYNASKVKTIYSYDQNTKSWGKRGASHVTALAIAAISDRHAVIVGENGKVYKTGSRGDGWKEMGGSTMSKAVSVFAQPFVRNNNQYEDLYVQTNQADGYRIYKYNDATGRWAIDNRFPTGNGQAYTNITQKSAYYYDLNSTQARKVTLANGANTFLINKEFHIAASWDDKRVVTSGQSIHMSENYGNSFERLNREGWTTFGSTIDKEGQPIFVYQKEVGAPQEIVTGLGSLFSK